MSIQFNRQSYLAIIRPSFFSTLIIIIVIALSAFGAQKWLTLRSSQVVSEFTPAQINQQQKREPVQVVRFAFYKEGIYPREAHVGHGLIAISIENLSGASNGLMITREISGKSGEDIATFANNIKKQRSRYEIKLTPGRYEIADISNPSNKATLIVGQEKVGDGS